MARVKNGAVTKARRKKVLKQAKGYFGSKHRLFKTAKEQVMHSYVYAYRDRKQNKRNFRKLWIVRINAACRENEKETVQTVMDCKNQCCCKNQWFIIQQIYVWFETC